MPTWHLSPALDQLRDEINAKFPGRDRSTDGTIGDAAHASRTSQHNPDPADGSVNAVDMDDDGWPAVACRDYLIGRARAGLEPRLWYIIHNGQIWSRASGFVAKRYTGPNPHTSHFHLSIYYGAATEDSRKRWLPTFPPPPEEQFRGDGDDVYRPGSRVVRYLDAGTDVQLLQRWLGLKDDGYFGRGTEAAVRAYQAGRDLDVDGVAGDATWAPILTALGLART